MFDLQREKKGRDKGRRKKRKRDFQGDREEKGCLAPQKIYKNVGES